METLWWLLLLTAPAALARDVTDCYDLSSNGLPSADHYYVTVQDEEYARFPRLYHLDDYSTCLAQTDGLYCLGSFHIEPLSEPHHLYNMLKEYSQDRHHFNRTQVHRGYCVSARCPAPSNLAAPPGAGGDERNASHRFANCVSRWARRLALRSRLAQLSYCRTHAQEYAYAHNPVPLDAPQKLFLFVVLAIVAFNAVGTVYDVATGDNAKKSALLSAWSVRGNWRRLTATHEDGDQRLAALAPVQGLRVLLMLLIIATHSGCIHVMLYLYNPRWIEQISRHPVLMIFLNGTSVVQIFVLLSNFLLAYNLLLYSKSNKISFKLLPYITIKRIARISPVYLLVVGYAATWWARAGAGPQWAPSVGAESDACRRKFWTHVFYVNNLLDPEDICLVQTWFLAVDMQLYVAASVLTVYLAQRRRCALPVLVALVLLSCLLNGALAYVFDWKSIMYFAYPSTLKTMYAGIPSFSRLYQAPWGSLPACLLGLLLAFLHFELQESGAKVASLAWVRVLYALAPWLAVGWLLAGTPLRAHEAAWLAPAHVALERPVLSLLAGASLLGMLNGLDGWAVRLLAWRGWRAPARLSLAVLLAHWSLNLALAAHSQPREASLGGVVLDWVATSCGSYLLAVPLTVMLELPAQRSVAALLLRTPTKQA